MKNSRILGNNVALEINSSNLDLNDFAISIGFSENDVRKLLGGRLFIPPFQLVNIANALNISVDVLLAPKGRDEYNTLVHNVRDFNEPKNQELILDLIDMYADLEEALA